MLAGLFAASYAGLLWLTSADHAADVPNATEATHAPASEKVAMQAGTPPDTSSPDNSRQQTAAELPLPVQGELAQPHPEQALDTAAQITQQDAAAQQLAFEPTPQKIEAAARALRSGADRETRLLAAKSLLLMGRKSIVDPAITQALREASSDSDQLVAAQATAALAEVERATH